MRKHAVLLAYPLPDPPILQIRRADGGYDPWPDYKDAAYLTELSRARGRRAHALWLFYLEVCLRADAPVNWYRSPEWLVLARAGVQPRCLKVDWAEYAVIGTVEDRRILQQAFRAVNDVTPEDREAALAYFNARWDGEPVPEAAERLPRGRLTFDEGYAQYAVALRLGLLPFHEDDLPEEMLGRIAPLYYDLPPRLRARLEVYIELEASIEALRAHDALRRS